MPPLVAQFGLPFLALGLLMGAQHLPLFPVTVAAGENWTEGDFIQVSNPASPRVAYALRQNADQVEIRFEVADAVPGGGCSVAAGLHAAKTVMLKPSDAKVTHDNNTTTATFVVPAASLIDSPADWDKFQFAFAVSWPGGPFGTDRQRERFLHVSGAAGAGLSPDPSDWQPFDLKAHADLVANGKKRIFVEFDQPMDGKASIVIEDANGNRIRNLVSGQDMTKGHHEIEWDGLDEQGNVVPAGDYHWRAVSHPGITPDYLFSFYSHGNPPWRGGGPGSIWLADHSNAIAAASYGDRVYLGCPVAESGHNVAQLNLNGDKTAGLNFPTLVGIGTLFLAADEKYFYAVMEGTPAYEPFQDQPDGTWTYRRPLNILRWDLTAQPVNYDGKRGEKVVLENLYHGTGPHPRGTRVPEANNLAGAALFNGKFYLSLRNENRILIVSAEDGSTYGEIKINDPGMVASDGKNLLVAFSGKTLMKIDTENNAASPLFTPALSERPKIGDAEYATSIFAGHNPTGLAIDGAEEIFMSDNGVDQNVKVYSVQGQLLREIGKKGGRPINGTWDGTGMYQPHGITVDSENKLWVTETDAFPRRNSVWNAQTGALMKEFFGPDFYGAPGGSFDTADHTRWIGGGEQWKLDFDKKTATPVATLYHQSKPGQLQNQMMGCYWNFYHTGGRTFLIGYGEGQSVYEIRPDGSAKLWAFCGDLPSIAQKPRWTLPKTITDLPAVKALFAENAVAKHNPPLDQATEPFGPWQDNVKFNEALMHNGDKNSSISLLWVDKNGDDLGQADEFEVLPSGDTMGQDAWGAGNPTLDLNIPASIGGKKVLLHLKADGFLPSGAPNYSLAKALASAVPVEPQLIGSECVQDRFGREIFNSTPTMKAVAPDGHTLWSFPNQWAGVQGSHDAPLPQTGVMQGVLYFLGTAPLDDKSEVMVMNGNHGRFFVMTTDGIYLDEMFKDVRVTQIADAYLIGGECFGGYFGKGEDGNYYLQSGHTDYRVFRINGLDKLQRSEGALSVSPDQVIAAQANVQAKVAETIAPKTDDIGDVPATTKLSPDPHNWPGVPVATWGDPHQPFPYAEVRALRYGDQLKLYFRVRDPSPWVNHGNDWTLLFKTGDCCVFEYGTDPSAKASRQEAAPGDQRLLIAPFKDKPLAVLYSYNVPGTPVASSVSFSSPARTVKVDKVTQLTSAQITVTPTDGWYEVSATIPLADLGLPPSGQAVTLHGDFGVIYGDSAGSMDLLRSYWSNQATGLVNDIPGEVSVTPNLWGTLNFTAAPPQ
jgi:hypothetical protein